MNPDLLELVRPGPPFALSLKWLASKISEDMLSKEALGCEKRMVLLVLCSCVVMMCYLWFQHVSTRSWCELATQKSRHNAMSQSLVIFGEPSCQSWGLKHQHLTSTSPSNLNLYCLLWRTFKSKRFENDLKVRATKHHLIGAVGLTALPVPRMPMLQTLEKSSVTVSVTPDCCLCATVCREVMLCTRVPAWTLKVGKLIALFIPNFWTSPELPGMP